MKTLDPGEVFIQVFSYPDRVTENATICIEGEMGGICLPCQQEYVGGAGGQVIIKIKAAEFLKGIAQHAK